MPHKYIPEETDERQREIENRIRKKRSDMMLKIFRDEYGRNIAKRYQPDAGQELAEAGGPQQPPEKKP